MRGGGLQLAQEAVEPARGHACGPALQGGVEGAHQPVGVPAGPGRQVDVGGPGDVGQVVLDLPQEHLLALLVHQVPLVVDQDQGTAGIDGLLDDAHVLLADRLGGVQQDDGDLGLVDGALRAQHRVVVGAP